jgi:hypothetical protein
MMRTVENAMPAVTTELDWTTQDVVKFMLQTGRFRDADGSLSQSRADAAQAYLRTDWDRMLVERFKSPGFDPERPGLDEVDPGWKENEKVQSDLATYFAMKGDLNEQLAAIQSGPNDEYTRAENALLMCQRVDLWCAGEAEVERAVQHLYRLGKMLNRREVDLPAYIAEFAPGRDDMDA